MDIKEALEVLNENTELGGHIGKSLTDIIIASKATPALARKASITASRGFSTRDLESTLEVLDFIKDIVEPKK